MRHFLFGVVVVGVNWDWGRESRTGQLISASVSSGDLLGAVPWKVIGLPILGVHMARTFQDGFIH